MLRSGNAYINNKRPLDSSLSSDTPTTSPKQKPKRKKKGKQQKMSATNATIPPINETQNSTILQSNLDNFATNLNFNPTPNISDVMNGISIILSKLDTIQLDLDKSNNRISKNEKDIAELQGNMTKHNTELMDVKSNINKLNQLQIDNEVMLSGFSKPLQATEIQEIAHNLCSLYKINTNRIHKYYSINTNGGQSALMIIKFWDKEDQLSLIANIISNGPPAINQLLSNSDSLKNDVIRCFGRLTKENVDINRRLRQLKRENKIYAVKYRNLCFHYQERVGSPLIPVSCIDQITIATSDSVSERFKTISSNRASTTTSQIPTVAQHASEATQHAAKATLQQV